MRQVCHSAHRLVLAPSKLLSGAGAPPAGAALHSAPLALARDATRAHRSDATVSLRATPWRTQCSNADHWRSSPDEPDPGALWPWRGEARHLLNRVPAGLSTPAPTVRRRIAGSGNGCCNGLLAAHQLDRLLRSLVRRERIEVRRVTIEPPEIARVDGADGPRHGAVELLKIRNLTVFLWQFYLVDRRLQLHAPVHAG